MSYIVPRDTPKTCSGCTFSRLSQIYEGKYWCVLNESDEAIYVELHQKSFNCPLVEIPTPHGRLIDGDAYIKMMEEKCDHESSLDEWVLKVCRGGVSIMPTVIEAEG